MEVIVKKWGNSAVVRIPASIMAAAHVALDQPVDIREEQDSSGHRQIFKYYAACSVRNCSIFSGT